MTKMLILGEILVDLFGDPINGFVPHCGGAPANVAIGVAKLGSHVTFLGQVGNDFFGEFLMGELLRNGVDPIVVWPDNKLPTTLALVAVSPEGERSFIFYPGAHQMIPLEYIRWLEFPKNDIFHCGGFLQASNNGDEVTQHCLRKAVDSNMLISYDPNVRLNVWSSGEACRIIIQKTVQQVHIIKMNEEEVGFLNPEGFSLEIWMKEFYRSYKTILLLVVTRGSKGCAYCYGDGERVEYINGMEVEVKDTTGAGDAFMAALLHGISETQCLSVNNIHPSPSVLRDILTRAVVVSALTCIFQGAVDHFPTKEMIDEGLKKYTL